MEQTKPKKPIFIEVEKPDFSGGFLLYGRRLAKAINMRIVLMKTSVDYYKACCAELEIGRKTPIKEGHKRLYKTYVAGFEELLHYYESMRDRLYAQADAVNANKSDDYKQLFKMIFLDGLSRAEAYRDLGLTKEKFDSVFVGMQRDLFDCETDEYGFYKMNQPMWAYAKTKVKEREEHINDKRYKKRNKDSISQGNDIPDSRRSEGKDETEGDSVRETCKSVHAKRAGEERELDKDGVSEDSRGA